MSVEQWLSKAWIARALVASAAIVPFLPLLKAWYGADDFYFVERLTTGIEPGTSIARAIFVDNLGTSGGFYRPLALLSLFVDLRAGSGGAVVPHAVNILLHACTAIGVLELARRLAHGSRALWPATLGAVAFAVFPRRVEAVAWVSCRPDLLATCLVVLAGRAACEASSRARWASLALWTASLLSKESTALMPIALMAAHANAGPPGARMRSLKWLVPFGLAGSIVIVIRRLVGGGWVGGYREQHLVPGVTSLVSAAKHVAYAFVPPIDVLADPLRDPTTSALVSVVMGTLCLVIVAGTLRWRSRPAMRAGVTWFAAALVPVLAFAPSLSSPLNDRLMYLPGVAVALALAAIDWPSRRVVRGAIAIVLVMMAGLTFQRARYWPVAGRLTREWLATVERTLRTTRSDCRLYVAGGPDSLRGAYMLRSGWDWGLDYLGDRPTEGRIQPLALYFLDTPDDVPIDVRLDAPDMLTIASVGRHPAVLPLAIPAIPGVVLVDIVPGGDRFGRVHRVRVRLITPGVIVAPRQSGPTVIGAVGPCAP